jgi:peptidoglycan/LPS O-acetylase OafA/YrhL
MMDKNDKSRPYITALTPLRGIAALFVVMHHSSLYFGSFVPSSTVFFENGWIWVDFFFILSGFIITYSYGGYFKDRIALSAYKKYMWARFARVYPLHLATLLWAFAVAAAIVYFADGIDKAVADHLNLKALLPCLLLMQDLHLYKSSPLNFPAWSLSAEWWMYSIFPFLVPYFTTLTKKKKIISLFLIIATYVSMRYVLGPVSGSIPDGAPKLNMVADFGLLRCVAGFCTGMLLFEFYKERKGYSLFKNSWCFILFFCATLFSIHANVIDILIIALFPFVLLSAAYNETVVKKILNAPILQRLGDWSFSIYLVHGPVILMLLLRGVYKDPTLLSNLTSAATGGAGSSSPVNPGYKIALLYCMVILAVTLVVSAFTYRFIEVPAAKYLKKVFKTNDLNIREGDRQSISLQQ